MNCCDYNCNQGRNCPARVAKVGQRTPAAEPLSGKTWRDYMPDLAGWALAVVAVLMCYSILIWGFRESF